MVVAIKNFTRRPVAPRAVFTAIAKQVLPGWDISLVFVGPAKARALNSQLRGKDYIPNVLSYALGNKNAEIIICPAEAAKQASSYGLLPSVYCLLLFIHGALHVKGWVHSARMEKCEQKLLAGFAKGNLHSYPHGPKNRNRH